MKPAVAISVIAGLAGSLVLASCGGGGGSKPAATKATTSTSSGAVAAAAGGTSGKAATGKVLIRIANYYAPPDHPSGVPVEVYVPSDANPNPKEGAGTPDIGPTAYGAVSDYKAIDATLTGELLMFAPGQPEQLAEQNIDGTKPARITFVLAASETGTLSTTSYTERPTQEELNDPNPQRLPAAPSGKALLVAVGTPLLQVTPKVGYNLGQPGKGCFALQTPDPPNGGQTNIPSGGSLQYVADPGSLQVAYFDSSDGQCTGAPLIGPIPVTVAAGDRSYVIAEGATKPELRLVALSIPVLPGDSPLLAAPPTTSPDAGALDPCTLVTPADAAASLGGTLTATKPDKSQGTCEYDVGAASLQITAVVGGGGTVFDLLHSGATSPQAVSGMGDRGFTTTDPANAIVIQKGDNLVGIGMSLSATGGPADDPAHDAPILKSLEVKALTRVG